MSTSDDPTTNAASATLPPGDLERALGVLLLVRGPGRRMILTAEGRQLHAFITPYFERLPGVPGRDQLEARAKAANKDMFVG